MFLGWLPKADGLPGIAAIPFDIIPKQSNQVYKVKQYRRHDRSIINNQRERTYYLDGKPVAKNRRPRFEQEGDSLDTYLAQFPIKQQRAICSKLTVKPSTRRYNNLDRHLPGCIFYYKNKRYILSGQLNNGAYLRAYGIGNKNFKASECQIIPSGGLVYV